MVRPFFPWPLWMALGSHRAQVEAMELAYFNVSLNSGVPEVVSVPSNVSVGDLLSKAQLVFELPLSEFHGLATAHDNLVLDNDQPVTDAEKELLLVFLEGAPLVDAVAVTRTFEPLAQLLEEAKEEDFRLCDAQGRTAIHFAAMGDRKSTRLNSSHRNTSRMPSSA